jgi:hypothetical protein
MPKKVDVEIDAIKSLLDTLTPLSQEVRQAVLEYVLKRLDFAPTPISPFSSRSSLVERIESSLEPQRVHEATPTHLKELKEQKKPKSAIEMAVLVAYYLAYVVPVSERKDKISTKDIEAYFKIGGYKLPSRPEFTLGNARNAGYLDLAGRGQYKLNPVGYNLVVHSLPRSAS